MDGTNYGQLGTIDNFDNNSSFMNSHMCKNSEWGAVAYLTHSKYRRNGHKIIADSDSNMSFEKIAMDQEYFVLVMLRD